VTRKKAAGPHNPTAGGSPAPGVDLTPEERIAALVRGDGATSAANDDEPLSVKVSAPGEGGGPEWYDVVRMNREWALVLIGSKAVIVRELPDGPVDGRLRIISISAFRDWLLNTYTPGPADDGKRGTTWAHRWLVDKRRRQYAGIEFFPNPDGAVGTPGYLNLWRGFSVVPQHGDGGWSILRDHLLNNVCDGDEGLFRWVFGWFAHMVQRPRERVGTALVMRGKMGTGKTKVGEVVGSLFQAHYFAVDDPRYVTGQFNAHMAGCLLLQAEEAVWAGDKAAEGRLKGLVTSTFQMIEAKGIDPIRLDNFVRLMMTSNEDWVVPAGKDERRFCVLDVNPRVAQNTDYFREMEEQLANGGREALLYDLLHFDLGQVDLRKIPRTDALLEQKLRSLDSVDAWWHGRLSAGTVTSSHVSWVAMAPRDEVYQDYIRYCESVGERRRRSPEEMGIALNKLVPRLSSSRPMMSVDGEQKRVRCYVFPPLDDCREHFESALEQPLHWDAPEG
jgi:hypothetical protein